MKCLAAYYGDGVGADPKTAGPLGGFVVFQTFGIERGRGTCVSEDIDGHDIDGDKVLGPRAESGCDIGSK